MERPIKRSLRALLTIALALGMLVSANSRMVSHDLAELALIVAEHHVEVEEHGHAHEDIVDLVHALHDHADEIADHDHNMAFLPPRPTLAAIGTTGSSWTIADYSMPDRNDYGLDRPPRA